MSGRAQQGSFLSMEDMGGRLVILTSQLEILQGLADSLASASGGAGTFATGISSKGETVGQLRMKYEEARHALKYRILLSRSESALIHYERLDVRDPSYRVSEDTIRKLANMLGTDRDKEMKALLMELFAAKALSEVDIGYFEALSQALNEKVFDQVFHTYGEASVEIIKMYKLAGNLYNFTHIQDYIHCVQNLLFALNDYIRHLRSIHVDQKDMAKAVEYIQANYAKDLSMTMVSNYVSLNYSYFSQAFKDFVGTTFVNYLKTLRIEKAKELLETTELKVLEIGDRVGFENTKHFNRVFKEMQGVTPLEYLREQERSPERDDKRIIAKPIRRPYRRCPVGSFGDGQLINGERENLKGDENLTKDGVINTESTGCSIDNSLNGMTVNIFAI